MDRLSLGKLGFLGEELQFREICLTQVEDGVVFDPDSVKGAVIRKDAGYGGVRIDIQAKLDGARMLCKLISGSVTR